MKKRPLSLTLASLLLVFALVAGVGLPMLITTLTPRGQGLNRQFAQGGNSSQNGGNTQGGGNAQGGGNTQRGGNTQGGGGFQRNPFGSGGAGIIPGVRIPGLQLLGIRTFTTASILTLCLRVIVGIAILLAAIGLWQRKKWGFILALIVTVAAIALAVPELISGLSLVLGRTRIPTAASNFINGTRVFGSTMLPAVVRIVLMVASFVLVLLPSSRKAIFVEELPSEAPPPVNP